MLSNNNGNDKLLIKSNEYKTTRRVATYEMIGYN